MPEFIDLLPPQDALEKFLGYFQFRPIAEEIDTRQARGRVVLQDMHAPHSLPTFNRSTVDGFAVRATDTHGASDSMPAYLELVGEIRMGQEADISLSNNQCGLIHTGGMLPLGADAVVMLENTQVAREKEIEILRPAAVGENMLKIGEDIQQGNVVVPAGKILGAADIGGLLALGLTRVRVSRKPIIGIISSGDEVVPPESDINLGQVRDINSYSLAALIEKSLADTRNLRYRPGRGRTVTDSRSTGSAGMRPGDHNRRVFCQQPGSHLPGDRQPGRTRGDRARRKCSPRETDHPGCLSSTRH